MSFTTHIQILLVDDHAILRQGLRILLNSKPDLHIVGEAGSGEAAVNAALKFQPDIILLDLFLPDVATRDLLPELRRVSPRSRVLILSGNEAADAVYEAVDAGIDGYALKNMETADLVNAIHEVAAGNSYLHPTITRLVLFRVAQTQPAGGAAFRAGDPDAPARLTRRQMQVLTLLATTATNREIAERLRVSEETVRTHVKHILKRLDVSTRTQAVVEAMRLGLISV